MAWGPLKPRTTPWLLYAQQSLLYLSRSGFFEPWILYNLETPLRKRIQNLSWKSRDYLKWENKSKINVLISKSRKKSHYFYYWIAVWYTSILLFILCFLDFLFDHLFIWQQFLSNNFPFREQKDNLLSSSMIDRNWIFIFQNAEEFILALEHSSFVMFCRIFRLLFLKFLLSFLY